MRKAVLVMVAFGLLFFSFQPVYAQAAKPAKLKIGYLPIVDCLQLFVAIDKGYLAKEALSAELVILGGGTKILGAMAGGSLDLGFTATVPLIFAVAQGFDFKIIADGAYDTKYGRNNSVIMATRASGIERPRDLEGKKVAVNTIRQIADLFVMELVRSDGGDPKTITFLEIPFPQEGPVLIKGQVDAANLVEPFYTIYGNDPKIKFLAPLFRWVRSGVMIANYAASAKWISRHQSETKRFASAMRQATDYIQGHGDETRMVLTKFTRLKADMAKKISIKDFGKHIKMDDLEWYLDKLYGYGWIKKRLKAGDLVYQTAR